MPKEIVRCGGNYDVVIGWDRPRPGPEGSDYGHGGHVELRVATNTGQSVVEQLGPSDSQQIAATLDGDSIDLLIHHLQKVKRQVFDVHHPKFRELQETAQPESREQRFQRLLDEMVDEDENLFRRLAGGSDEIPVVIDGKPAGTARPGHHDEDEEDDEPQDLPRLKELVESPSPSFGCT